MFDIEESINGSWAPCQAPWLRTVACNFSVPPNGDDILLFEPSFDSYRYPPDDVMKRAIFRSQLVSMSAFSQVMRDRLAGIDPKKGLTLVETDGYSSLTTVAMGPLRAGKLTYRNHET
jgi:hypothetical protein